MIKIFVNNSFAIARFLACIIIMILAPQDCYGQSASFTKNINHDPLVKNWLEELGQGPNGSYYLPEGRFAKKKALIISNWDYPVSEDFSKLDQAEEDFAKAKEVFTRLHYEITEIKNFKTVNEFSTKIRPWLATLTDNDIIAIYYSGHGFSYNGREFMYPLKVKHNFEDEEDLYENAVDLRLLVSKVSDFQPLHYQSPRFIWVLFDACRVEKKIKIGQEELDPDDPKGAARKRVRPTRIFNTEMFLASRNGHPSYAPGSKPVKPSHFTSSFYDLLSKPNNKCGGLGCINSNTAMLYSDLLVNVPRISGEKQFPERIDWATSELVFVEFSERSLNNQRLKWSYMLAQIIDLSRRGHIDDAEEDLNDFIIMNAYSVYIPQMKYIQSENLIRKTLRGSR